MPEDKDLARFRQLRERHPVAWKLGQLYGFIVTMHTQFPTYYAWRLAEWAERRNPLLPPEYRTGS